MDIEALRKFLIESNKAGYAGGKEEQWTKESDGSTTIPFEQGDFRSHDNFFGGEPYGGRAVVFYKQKPVWIMAYYGYVAQGVENGPIYTVIKNATLHMPHEAPFRGPPEFKYGDYTYSNTWNGDIQRFSGQEQIKQGEELLYQANYVGGLVDQK